MNLAGFVPKNLVTAGVVVASAIGLSGCFDLSQQVALHSNGSGTYAVVVSAHGIVGDGLEKKKAHIDIGDNDMTTHIAHVGDKVVQTSSTSFRDLSDLRLSDETILLHVLGKKDFGLGGTEVNFHRSFHVNHARERNEDENHVGHDILTSMFGDHTYTFSVWLPGSIEHIGATELNGHVVTPQVWSDKYGHTVVWKMKLVDMFMAQRVDFDVDFVAHGDFHDSESRPGESHHHDS